MSKNGFSEDFIASQRKRLHELRTQLLSAEDSALKEVNDLQESRGEEASEYEDEAQSMDAKEVLQAKHDVDRQRLLNIDRALKKIELGTYGLSDVSGKAIPKARLEVIPEAVMTVNEAAAKR